MSLLTGARTEELHALAHDELSDGHGQDSTPPPSSSRRR